MPAAELRPSQVRALVRELERLPSPRGGKLASRTVLHVYRTLRQVFAGAVADELLERNPVVLNRADLPAKLDKDPAWREGAQFTPARSPRCSSTPVCQRTGGSYTRSSSWAGCAPERRRRGAGAIGTRP